MKDLGEEVCTYQQSRSIEIDRDYKIIYIDQRGEQKIQKQLCTDSNKEEEFTCPLKQSEDNRRESKQYVELG